MYKQFNARRVEAVLVQVGRVLVDDVEDLEVRKVPGNGRDGGGIGVGGNRRRDPPLTISFVRVVFSPVSALTVTSEIVSSARLSAFALAALMSRIEGGLHSYR